MTRRSLRAEGEDQSGPMLEVRQGAYRSIGR